MDIQNQFLPKVVLTPPSSSAMSSDMVRSDMRTGMFALSGKGSTEPLLLINLEGSGESGLLASVTQFEQELRAFFQNLFPRESFFLNPQTNVQSSLQLSELALSGALTNTHEVFLAKTATNQSWESLLSNWAHSSLITAKNFFEESCFPLSFQHLSDRGQQTLPSSFINSSLMNLSSPFQALPSHQALVNQPLARIFQESPIGGRWQFQKNRPLPYERNPKKHKESGQTLSSLLRSFTQKMGNFLRTYLS